MSGARTHPRTRLAAAALLVGALSPLVAPRALASEPPLGTTHALIVCGHPGDAEHRALYADSVTRMRRALIDRFGFPAENVWVRFGAHDDGEPALDGSRGPSDKASLEKDAAELVNSIRSEDEFWLIVLGHASDADQTARINLPGPDAQADEFGRWFANLECRQTVIFVTTPLSGYFLKPLAHARRVVIAATQPDGEGNETLYHASLATALESISPGRTYDFDGDGVMSLLDLHLNVVRDVEKKYLDEKHLITEHAQLDDNGDGRGTEVQFQFTTPEQGAPSAARTLNGDQDGALAQSILLPLDQDQVDAPAASE